MQRFEVEYFEKEDGTYPAEEFILSQDVKMRAKLFRLLELLEEKGNTLREPYSKAWIYPTYDLVNAHPA